MPLTLTCGTDSLKVNTTKADLLQFLYNRADFPRITLIPQDAKMEISLREAENLLMPKKISWLCGFFSYVDDSHLNIKLLEHESVMPKEIHVDFRRDIIDLTHYARFHKCDAKTLLKSITNYLDVSDPIDGALSLV